MVKTAVKHITKFTRSLSFKLSFYAGLIMLLALMAFSYRSISSQEKNLVDKIVQGALKDSEVMKAAILNGMMSNDRQAIREIVQAIGRRGFEQINIYDSNRQLRYSNRDLVGGDNSTATDPLLKDIAENTEVRHRFSRSGTAIYMVNPLLNNRGCYAAACHAHPESQKVLGALEVKLPLDGVKQEIFENTRNTVIFGFLLFILISSVNGLAAIFLVNRNLSKLKSDAVRMARGDFGLESQIAGSDEIGGILSLLRRHGAPHQRAHGRFGCQAQVPPTSVRGSAVLHDGSQQRLSNCADKSNFSRTVWRSGGKDLFRRI